MIKKSQESLAAVWKGVRCLLRAGAMANNGKAGRNMGTEWMGRYRNMVEAMIRFGNVYAQTLSEPGFIECSAEITGEELQVLEYILENEVLHLNMAEIAKRLSIPQSSFSKLVKRLTQKGLLEKYHSKSNRKNVIICVSEYGKKVYDEYVQSSVNGKWGRMFENLDDISEDSLAAFTQALNGFCEDVLQKKSRGEEKEEELLIRIE